MNDADFRLLLDTAYATWRDCLDAHAGLARKVAGGSSVGKSDLARVRADLDRALADFMSMSAQTDPHMRVSESGLVTATQIVCPEFTAPSKPEIAQRLSAG